MARNRCLAVTAALLSVVAVSCSSSTKNASVPRGSGAVDVLYAGSLLNTMEKQIAPAFHAATGYTVTGFSAGSDALAEQIKGKVRIADVFISASPSVNSKLEGPSNGSWVSWYATFATAPLVLGYNGSSRFANDLKTKPWYQVITQPGFLLGRTDPATDPKGKLTVTALDDASQKYGEPGLAALGTSSSNVFPEETLVGRLEAGQLDAGFFYTSETTPASIPTVLLSGLDLKATYTVTVVKNAPDDAGAQAFVEYLLGSAGQATLSRNGFDVVHPYKVTGSGVPGGLSKVLPAS